MTFEQFDKFTEELFTEVRKMRDTKGKEYAQSEDRFANFNRLAEETGLPRETVWLVYFTKHWDAIRSYLKNGREFSDESARSRIIDSITYLMLLAGMLEETGDIKSTQLQFHTLQPSDEKLPYSDREDEHS